MTFDENVNIWKKWLSHHIHDEISALLEETYYYKELTSIIINNQSLCHTKSRFWRYLLNTYINSASIRIRKQCMSDQDDDTKDISMAKLLYSIIGADKQKTLEMGFDRKLMIDDKRELLKVTETIDEYMNTHLAHKQDIILMDNISLDPIYSAIDFVYELYKKYYKGIIGKELDLFVGKDDKWKELFKISWIS